MPLFVHLTSERIVRSIVRAGLHGPRGVYCLPMLPDYYRTHQWLRELKRSGQRTIVAVDFRLAAEERVLVGHYNQPHLETTADAAARIILAANDNLGYEVIVPGAIGPRAVHRVRRLSQLTGWRYAPEAKGRPPCGCPGCLRRGEIKSRQIRQHYLRTECYSEFDTMPYPNVLAELRRLAELVREDPEDSERITDVRSLLGYIGHWKAGMPEDLAFLLEHRCAEIVETTAWTLSVYRSRQARMLLLESCKHQNVAVREADSESLLECAGSAALALLAPLAADAGIARVLAQYEAAAE